MRAWRKAQRPKVTQEALGEAVGVSGSYIRHYENKKLDLSLPVKVRLGRRTGIPLEALLTKDQLRMVSQAANLLPGGATAA